MNLKIKKILPSLIAIILIQFVGKSAVIYVSPTGSGVINGSSWDNAYQGSQLQFAINLADNGDSIFVACGTYRPTTGNNRSVSFSMKNNVKIFGSFENNENDPLQRIFSCGPCSILSGNINNASIATDNSYKVILNRNLNSTALLDGFVIRDGYDQRNPTGVDVGLGGGIYNGGSGANPGNEGSLCSPTIRNCVIQNNYASFGAGIFNNGHQNGNASPFLDGCIISNNTAFISGGGIDNFGWMNGNASPQMKNCLVVNNQAALRAGGMYCWGGSGGNANPGLINCTFANNHAASIAGGLIADNSNNLDGSPPFSGNANIILKNTILWGNTAPQGPQFYINGGTVSATYSNINLTGQLSPHLLTGLTTGNLFTDPKFLDTTSIEGIDNCLMSIDDGFGLDISSPNINGGNMGDSLSNDLAQSPRLSGLSVDIGAYEHPLPDTCFWTGLYDQSWENAQNWQPKRVPDSDQMIYIPSINSTVTQPILHNLQAACRQMINYGIIQLTGTSTLTIKQ